MPWIFVARTLVQEGAKRYGKKKARSWAAREARRRGAKAYPSPPLFPMAKKLKKKSRGRSGYEFRKTRTARSTRKSMRGPSAKNRNRRSRRYQTGKAPYCWRHKRRHWCMYTKP